MNMASSVILMVPLLFIGGVFVATAKRRGVILLCVFISLIIVILVPFTRLSPEFGNLRIGLVIALVVLTAVVLLRGGAPKLSLPGLLIVLYLILSAAVTLSVGDSRAKLQFGLLTVMLVAGLLQGAIVREHKLMPSVVKMFIFIASTLSIYAVVEVLFTRAPLWRGAVVFPTGESSPLRHQFIEGASRAQATMAHPLPLAAILLLALCMTMAFATVHWRSRAIIAVVLVLGITASGSRNALVLAAALLLYFGARQLSAMRLPAYIFIGISAVIGIVFTLDSSVVSSGSFLHRMAAFESIGQLFLLREPLLAAFGSGVGSTADLYALGFFQADGLQAVDNQFVHSLATDGVVGLLLIMTVWAIAFKRGTLTYRLLILVFVAQAMIFDFLGWPVMVFLAWFVVGGAVVKERRHSSPEPIPEDSISAISAEWSDSGRSARL